jgi:predicted nucleotidyltransferase
MEKSLWGMTTLAAFDSVARGKATEKSDIDILSTFERPI